MKKMPCLFVREFTSDRSFTITEHVTPGCEWVISGDGVATRKWDGTAVLVRDGVLYARYDAKRGKTPPAGAIPCTNAPDPVTGHWPHWIEATRPEDKWIRAAHANTASGNVPDGTYEAIGPSINGNPELVSAHILVRHGTPTLSPPRTFEGLRGFLEALDAEGIVFHHPDGRMCKIRRDDFGFSWPLHRR